MRLLVLSIFAGAGTLYSFLAFDCYREEVSARTETPARAQSSGELPKHPEANLRRLRAAFAAEEYTDDLEPTLKRALEQAPSFYQPPFLLAAFHANRLERPELIASSFQAALARFPSNGRLQLTYAEWLLTPRATAPYRTYRAGARDGVDSSRSQALEHLTRATSLESDLARPALDLMVRFRVPVARWRDALPDNPEVRSMILYAADQLPHARPDRRRLLHAFGTESSDILTLRTAAHFGRKWGERELALKASESWHQAALEDGAGQDIRLAALSLAEDALDLDDSDRAFAVLSATRAELSRRGLRDETGRFLVALGEVYLGRNRFAMAESLFTEAATQHPSLAPAYFGLARALHWSGDRDGAVRELRRTLQLDPAHAPAGKLLAELLRTR